VDKNDRYLHGGICTGIYFHPDVVGQLPQSRELNMMISMQTIQFVGTILVSATTCYFLVRLVGAFWSRH